MTDIVERLDAHIEYNCNRIISPEKKRDVFLAQDARDEIARLRAENERLRGALVECRVDIDAYIWQEYPSDHPLHVSRRERDFAGNPARAALAGGE